MQNGLNFNERSKTIKLLEEIIGSLILDNHLSNIWQWICHPQKVNKRKNKVMGLHQTKKILHSKGNHQQNQRHHTEWEKLFENDIIDKGFYPKYIKSS